MTEINRGKKILQTIKGLVKPPKNKQIKKPINFKNGIRTKYMNKSFVQCPATRIKPGTENDKKPEPLTNCARCQLCAVPDRKSIVYFPAHSARKNKINNYLKKQEAKK